MPIMKWSNENKKFVNYYKTVELVVEDFHNCKIIQKYKEKGKKTDVEIYNDLFMAQRRFAQIVCGLIL